MKSWLIFAHLKHTRNIYGNIAKRLALCIHKDQHNYKIIIYQKTRNFKFHHMQCIKGKTEIFILVHEVKSAALIAQKSCLVIVIVFLIGPLASPKRCIVVKFAATTMQRAKEKLRSSRTYIN